MKLVFSWLRLKSWAKGAPLVGDVDGFASLSARYWCRDVVIDAPIVFLKTQHGAHLSRGSQCSFTPSSDVGLECFHLRSPWLCWRSRMRNRFFHSPSLLLDYLGIHLNFLVASCSWVCRRRISPPRCAAELGAALATTIVAACCAHMLVTTRWSAVKHMESAWDASRWACSSSAFSLASAAYCLSASTSSSLIMPCVDPSEPVTYPSVEGSGASLVARALARAARCVVVLVDGMG